MFGASTQQQQQQPQSQLQPPTATKETTTPAEEESLKRNTDCVYFLASPLTCKKGSECEYRHSDIARVNPRDCWYWLNGNCLNPKCAFRHPPLDGLLGIQVPTPTPVGPCLPPPQAASTPVGPANVSVKQGVPCIFFQKGFCLKGDRCPFFHSPPFAPNKVPQLAGATPVTESPYTNKAFGGLEKTTSKEQKVPQTNIPKPVERQPQVKPAARVETALSKNGVATDKYVPPSSAVDDELHRYRPTNVPQATRGDTINRSTRVVQPHVLDDNGNTDVDEFSREPSPGFDVLVDDELRDSDYYPTEDQFGHLNPSKDYDVGRSADYNSMVDVDRDLYRDPNGCDLYERVRGQQYGWGEDIVSTERKLGRQERKRYSSVGSLDQIDESDLRYRLAKQRRGNNGLRSVISRDHAHDNSDRDRSYRAPRRDGHRVLPLESSVSSRLWGRIKIPGRSASPDSRELERGRNRGRFSPGGPLITSYHGRLRDRINGRVEEDFNNLRGSRMRRDVINDDNKAKFNGPKRLAELKVVKNGESDRPSVGKRKFPKVEDHHQQSEGDVSFEGPKPLSEILKRKRGSESNEDGNQKQRKEKLKDAAIQVQSVKENTKSASSVSDTENMKQMEGGQSTLKRNVSEVGSEEGMIGEEAMGAYDRREGGAEEEPVDEEDYNVEGAEKEEEFLDDDEDDFAKKIGVMYS